MTDFRAHIRKARKSCVAFLIEAKFEATKSGGIRPTARFLRLDHERTAQTGRGFSSPFSFPRASADAAMPRSPNEEIHSSDLWEWISSLPAGEAVCEKTQDFRRSALCRRKSVAQSRQHVAAGPADSGEGEAGFVGDAAQLDGQVG